MSIKINVYNQKGEQTGDMKLSEKVFGVKINEALVHQACVTQMANERQVLAHTKIRSEVRGGGRKPWAQKGTGRARAGSNRSPIWIGGGVTFGPLKTRNFKKKINKKMKQKSILMVLSDRVANKNLIVLDKIEIAEYKTKIFDNILKDLEKKILPKAENNILKDSTKEEKAKNQRKPIQKRSILLVIDKKDEKTKFSAKNLVGVEIINRENINIVDLLKYRNLIIAKQAVEKLEEKYSK